MVLYLSRQGTLTIKLYLGFNAIIPKDITPQIAQNILNKAIDSNSICLCGKKNIKFIYERDIIFNNNFLPLHQNALIFRALGEDSNILAEETYYSIGSGFVKNSKEMHKKDKVDSLFGGFQINSAKDLMKLSNNDTKSLAAISYEYELQFHTREHIYDYCLEIWDVMQECFAKVAIQKN